MELPGNAKFCDVCGAPVNEPVENDRTMMADEEKGYDFGAFENDPAPRRRYDDEQNNAPRYEDDFENEPPRSGYADESNYRDNAPRRTNRRYQEPPNKNKKTALIISIIALVLVIAIIGGVIFFINRNTVSAAELQEAKDKYLPPAQAVTIDTSKDDPSNDDIQFKYDDRARIISCTYMANEKPYAQRYTYDDAARKLNIETSYRERPIYTKEIEYSRVKSPNTFENIDEYYVRLDEGSLGDDGDDNDDDDDDDEQEDLPTDAPTDPPTEAAEIVSAEADEALDDFLTRFISCYSYDQFEYDYRSTNPDEQNILVKMCQQFSCVDFDIYPGGGRTEGYHNDTAVSVESCPWWDEEKMRGTAMGVTTNDCYSADWICTNIFNVDENYISSLYNQGYENNLIWKEDTSSGSYYCSMVYGKGLIGYNIEVTDVKTDGKYSYVTYDRLDYNSDKHLETLYAVMEKKNIDGADYWSLYINTSDVPEEIEPFDPNS